MILFFYLLIAIPTVLWQKIFLRKKFPSFRERLGVDVPQGTGKVRIWIHAVSVGEVKAARPLVKALSRVHPTLLITTATLAGKEEALRSFPNARFVKIMPLDFSFVMRSWLEAFSPDWLLFVEGDVWPNLLREAKKKNVKTALVSGKISERSMRRFLYVPSFARRFWGRLDLMCVQNEEQRSRFSALTDRKIYVSGNLKLEIEPTPIDRTAMKKRFSIRGERVITVASTHAPEERELLFSLLRIPHLVLFLAPRHPERFQEVAHILEEKRIPFCRWGEARKGESVVLVDIMGQLPSCFSISRLAIVGGSFSSRVGGHNIWEPCGYGCPVLFGPHMSSQQELVQMVVGAGAGRQVNSEELFDVVCRELDQPTLNCKKSSFYGACSTRIMHLLFPKESFSHLG